MKKEEVQALIIGLKEGDDIRINIKNKTEEARVRAHIRRATAYGYVFCLTHLYNEIFYMEKRKEGDRDKYSKIIRNGKNRIQ